MAKIEDLIAEIHDTRLRDVIAREVAALKKQKKFGLVFEEHIPETVQIPSLPIKPGARVVKRGANNKETYLVEAVSTNGRAQVCRESEGAEVEPALVKDLVVIKRFGEPIYPALVPVAKLTRSEDKPYHAIINADNFHALQLLLYSYAGQVDVIYIDPPYNTGARDWKYNNEYVDRVDSWRHSKWLSFMAKRLRLAKHLLRPDGVLIVTIDVNELHHLAVLLEELFPEYLRYMVSIVINPKGVSEYNFARVEEQALYCCPAIARDTVLGAPVDFMPGDGSLLADDSEGEKPEDEQLVINGINTGEDGPAPSADQYEYQLIRRRGTESRREDRPSMFYPVYINEKDLRVIRVGEPIPLNTEPSMKHVDGLRPVWPIAKGRVHGRWQVGAEMMQRLIETGDIVLGAYNKTNDSWTINRRVPKKTAKRLKTVWRLKSHDAGTHGTVLLTKILGTSRTFPFPKSLYAVCDSIRPVVKNRPNALIVDFFAGSGTTYHATALLNAEDGGSRRCVLVTNNEVSEGRAKDLNSKKHYAGDPEFEKHGICESVTWPRCKFVTHGHRDDGTPLPGSYLDGKELKDGFNENLEYFRLDFLDPHEVAYGEKFEAVLPMLWLAAGAKGERDTARGYGKWFLPKGSPYAVLMQEDHFAEFKRQLKDRPDITHVFLVTDSEEAFREMAADLPGKLQTRMLYKSYLDNFRINTERSL
jgi:adenine-specific DNA-methyltransferase